MKSVIRALALLSIAAPSFGARVQVVPNRGPVEVLRSGLDTQGRDWFFAGRLCGTYPAHESRRTVAIEARDDQDQVLLTRTAVATLDPATVRHKHRWTAGFRIELPASPALRTAHWSIQLEP